MQTSPHHFAEYEILEFNGRPIHALTVSGTPYDMGRWTGRLLGKEISQEVQTAFPSLIRKISILLNKRRGFEEEVKEAAQKFHKVLPPECLEEMQGIYDGCQEAGFPLEDPFILQKALALIELGEQECTLFALHSPATTGHTYQLRDLDYYSKLDMDYIPLLLVKIPQTFEGKLQGIPYANFDFVCNVNGGVLTGINQNGLAFSQSRGPFFKRFTYEGMPLKCIIQKILNGAATAPEAVDIIKNTPCATAHFVVVSDPLEKPDSLQLIFMEPGKCSHVPHSTMPDLSLINYTDESLRFYQPMEGAVYWTDMVNRRVNTIPADFNMKDMAVLL